MKIAAIALFLTGALYAQRIDVIVPRLGGQVVQDATGAWILAQSVSKPGSTDRDFRVWRSSEDNAGFDITIGGSGNDDVTGLHITPGGAIILFGTTDSRDFPASPSALWESNEAPGSKSARGSR